MKKYDENSVLRTLGKKGVILATANHISIPKNSSDIGIHSWGKIDYLCNYLGYTYSFYDRKVATNTANNASKSRKTVNKRERNAHALTDKTKRTKRSN